MNFYIEEHTGILIKKAARLFEHVANQDLDILGVTYAQTIFLIRLWGKDGQSQVDLARSSGLAQPTVVRALDRMERDGLISRKRNACDRRVFNFYLTDKAETICPKLESRSTAMNMISTKKMADHDIEQLNRYLLTIIENLEQYNCPK